MPQNQTKCVHITLSQLVWFGWRQIPQESTLGSSGTPKRRVLYAVEKLFQFFVSILASSRRRCFWSIPQYSYKFTTLLSHSLFHSADLRNQITRAFWMKTLLLTQWPKLLVKIDRRTQIDTPLSCIHWRAKPTPLPQSESQLPITLFPETKERIQVSSSCKSKNGRLVKDPLFSCPSEPSEPSDPSRHLFREDPPF